jgi:alpha-1,6-mannosyltransferase
LGPLRFAGLDAADGPLAGPLFYAGLWVALALYVIVVVTARGISRRVAIGVIAGLHLLFLLAPPLLSQDVFSYIAYARLGVEHDLNPYSHAPLDIPGDAVFGFAGSKDAVSVYGPLFTLMTYPLAALGLGTAFWALKLIAAAASLGLVWMVWRIAERLGHDPVPAALGLGIHPLVLCHVVAGAHNEALVMLVVLGGVGLWLAGRSAAGTVVATAAVGIKASAALVLPFLVAAGERPRRALVGAGATVVGLAVLALAVFGADSLDAFGLIGSNQDRTSRFSLPYKTAELFGAVLPGDRLDYSDPVRGVYAAAFAGVFLWLLWRTWRRRTPALDAIGWATLAILVASAWLVPWYILWLLPFATLSRDRRLHVATLALSAWMLAIAVPL